MADSGQGPGDQPAPGGVDPTVQQPDSFAAERGTPPPPPPHPGQPFAEYRNPGYGYPSPPPYPPPAQPPPRSPSPPSPSRTRRADWIALGLAALVLVLGIGGIVVIRVGHSSGKPAARATGPEYSMTGISDACDLVDPTPLTKWSPTPYGQPQHKETPPSAYYAGSLLCQIDYTTAGDPLDGANVILDVEFTNGSAPSSYANWKRGYAAKTGPGVTSGPVTGIGAQGFWHSEVYGDLVIATRYALCVQDDNVSVRIRLDFSRQQGVAPVDRNVLEPIAEAEARKALNGLKTH